MPLMNFLRVSIQVANTIVVMAVVMNRVEVTLVMRAVVIAPVMRVSGVSVEESECEVVN